MNIVFICKIWYNILERKKLILALKLFMSIYLCIDLKTFYASVECVERGLDPLTTNLVVADNSRTEKTICLAVTQSLKSYGISGRSRLFEVVQKVRDINNKRLKKVKKFSGKSSDNTKVQNDDSLELDYIIATPRMAHYIKYSSLIYSIYLKYVAAEDIHVYSIDEVFMDITNYLNIRNITPHDFAMTIIKDVLTTTGITATAGIGTNMYLAKVAMDIVAKKMKPDASGVRIASLTEESYRKELWTHSPLTDFWRVGKGYAKKLNAIGLKTMGDIALLSIKNEDILYDLFGINAELLIDHAWGVEPTTIKHIKNYKPLAKSLGTGQVLHSPYTFEKARLILKEMVDSLALDLVDKGFLTNQIVITIGYDIENLTNPEIAKNYSGEITEDYLGRLIPKHAHGTVNFKRYNASSIVLREGAVKLYDSIVNPILLIRRINISATSLKKEAPSIQYEQLSLFDNNDSKVDDKRLEKEQKAQESILKIKKRFGKNAIMKGMNLEDGATMKERNAQIGGHKA